MVLEAEAITQAFASIRVIDFAQVCAGSFTARQPAARDTTCGPGNGNPNQRISPVIRTRNLRKAEGVSITNAVVPAARRWRRADRGL